MLLKNKKQYLKEYRLKNKERLDKYLKIWTQSNKDKVRKNKTKWRLKNKNYWVLWKNSNINNKIAHNLRSRIGVALKRNVKSKKTVELLGCTIKEFWKYLENTFKPGMNKTNYGEWHIDHIKPCISFDLSKPEEQAKCFHYTNLQPLWAHENLSKGSKILN
jgi:hypothetical protein